ncbi:hypothetical protein GJ698_09715 [Pseudoduganella sp. FT26W]|uniref:HipA-like kinase domain-containing protein n=1 Tax=Duganella aquatilis TaxID=2666082 RepID=A0A844D6U3_9BURK|nr:HipA family kinase [Duganella aquatilis]MRW84362.1 hypothetical protein [Duganella aquatilis]
MMPLTVIEILGRSQEGRTEPYICRCDDGEIYFVKGKAATRRGLIAEWLCAELGSQLGLPIAPYAIATVPDELIEADLSGAYQDLGRGHAFASSRIGTTELNRTHLSYIPLSLRRDVLLFDWWINNADRNMTEVGGNPNLLWKPTEVGKLVIIDHNLAFDPDFDPAEFFRMHVFSSEAEALFADLQLRDAYHLRLTAALKYWPGICDTLPEEWDFIDAEQTIPAHFPFKAVKTLLDRVSTDVFWQIPS